MPFPLRVRINLLVRAGGHCCLCGAYCGSKIEIHHIIPESEGGTDEEDNGIPLCLNCHAEVRAYDDQHPIGTKFHMEELPRHRDRVFRWIEKNGPMIYDGIANQLIVATPESLVREDFNTLNSAVDLKRDAKGCPVPPISTTGRTIHARQTIRRCDRLL